MPRVAEIAFRGSGAGFLSRLHIMHVLYAAVVGAASTLRWGTCTKLNDAADGVSVPLFRSYLWLSLPLRTRMLSKPHIRAIATVVLHPLHFPFTP